MAGKKGSNLSPTELAALKNEMYSQVPIARAQIRSLRTQAEFAASRAANASTSDQIGHVLTSVMLAGFALELGLKVYCMTYGNERPRGHDLKELFDSFPEQVRNDISASFEASIFPKPPITVYGFTTAKDQPSAPSEVPESRYDTAENVLLHSATAFTKARYFFEDIKLEHWATIDHAVHYMLALSNVLDVVYDGYVEAGGWGPDHIQR